MAFEPVYNVIKTDSKRRLAAAQTVAECRLMPEAGIKIKKVLSISCAGNINTLEMLAGEARFSGRVSFKVLFSDDEGNLHCIAGGEGFSDKAVAAEITAGMSGEAECCVTDSDTASVLDGEIRLTCVLDVQLFADAGERITHLKEGGGDLFTQKETLEYCALSGKSEETFSISDERSSKEKPVRVLMCESQAVIKNAYAGIDCITAEGTAVTTVLIETAGKNVGSLVFNTDFSQEIQARGASAGNDVTALVAVKDASARLLGDGEEGNTVRTEIDLTVRASAFSQETAELVTDAFCVTNEVNMATESFKVSRFMFSKCFNERIEGSAPLDADMPFIDNICAVCGGRMNIAVAAAETDRVRIEGLINTGVIYFNREADSVSSVQVELPFSIALSAPGVKEGSVVMAKGIVTDIGARPRKGTEIDIGASVCISIQVFESRDGLCVKEIEIGAERDLKMSAIAVYITKAGESLWDVAKALCTTPELILSYNPGLKVPLSGNERILVYRQHTAKI